MAKIKIIYGYFLCILVCSGIAGKNTIDSRVAVQGDIEEKRKCVKELYDSQVGVREHGGANRGTQIEKYLKVTGLGPGYAWCASFVSWVYLNANIKAPLSGWVPSFALKSKRIYERGKFQKQEPQTGDVFMIWYPKLNRPAHIGFVDKRGDKTISTVEGNTNDNGSREGDGVYRKRRIKSQVWAVSDFVGSTDSQ